MKFPLFTNIVSDSHVVFDRAEDRNIGLYAIRDVAPLQHVVVDLPQRAQLLWILPRQRDALLRMV